MVGCAEGDCRNRIGASLALGSTDIIVRHSSRAVPNFHSVMNESKEFRRRMDNCIGIVD